MSNQKVISLSAAKLACSDCRVSALCLPLRLPSEEVNKLDEIINQRRPIPTNQYIFHAGARFDALYILRSGSVKNFIIDDDGQEHILAFNFSGDIIGLDGISNQVHISFAKTLEISSICEIPYNNLHKATQVIPNLQTELLRLISREFTHEHELTMLLNKHSAEERLAAFLLMISKRYQERGMSAKEFNLPMSRGDISNYLSLALETVSRSLTKMQQQGLIQVDKKHIKIEKMAELEQLSRGHPEKGSWPNRI
jgi:CRP/FNR family transcriptional regulator